MPENGRRVRVGVVGAGAWGKNHVRTWANLPEADLVAVCDGNPAALDAVAPLAGDAELLSSYPELLRRTDLEAVVLATPPQGHHREVHTALGAGLDVLVEKPLVMDPQEGQELVNLAADRGLVLMVGHLMRYHANVERLIELVARGDLGQVRSVDCVRIGPGKPRPESALWDLAPHDLSLVLAILGDTPSVAVGWGEGRNGTAPGESARALLRFPAGTTGRVQVSRECTHRVRTTLVTGSEGQALLNEPLGRDGIVLTRDGEEEACGVEEPWPALDAECRHFIDCIRRRDRPRTHGAEGLAVVRVLTAVQRSIERAGEPVTIE